MSGDFETLEINQPKIKHLKLEDNSEWLDKLLENIEDMKNNVSKNSQLSKIAELILDSIINILAIN